MGEDPARSFERLCGASIKEIIFVNASTTGGIVFTEKSGAIRRIEQRSDLLISTLRSYIEAMGGHLELIAEFPNRPPVVLSGLALAEPEPVGRRK